MLPTSDLCSETLKSTIRLNGRHRFAVVAASVPANVLFASVVLLEHQITLSRSCAREGSAYTT